ncbi:hypothetical protein [Nonomuraea guangzhouensis]|uniref:Uncharacterized protein n=1 Tax=Nonomuraea guangzhouensis TaxID=1291555 RepID=A0ABW4GWT0_9ACTN|nr:hypothetical protein [Nonomuraea guangzhouensis]
MADYTPPDDLIKLRRDFLAAQKRLPAAAGQAWLTLQGKCRELAVAIQEHKYWREVDDPKAARKALEDAVGGE